MQKREIILTVIGVMALGFLAGITYMHFLVKPEVQYIPYDKPYPVEVIKKVVQIEYHDKIVEVPVPIHNEPGLHEFESKKELREYLTWYEDNRMTEWGKDNCEDYAYDFMVQAIADGYLVSTELYEVKIFDNGVLHMANTVPVGNKVYLVNVSSNTIELLALKD